MNGFDRFRNRHPILLNSLLMVLALVALGYIALLFIDVFTSHGQQVQVPDVRNMPLEKAVEIIEDAGLHWEISDSTSFNENYTPGNVIDQDPKPKSYIKKIRIIYLSVNAMHAPLVPIPDMVNNMSGKAGRANLISRGFKYVDIDSVPSENEGLILQVTVDGHQVAPNTKVSVNSKIVITVGDGSIKDHNPEQVIDKAKMDSIDEANFKEEQETYEQEMKRAEQERREQEAKEKREANKDNKSSDKDKKKESDKKSDKDKKKN